MQLNEMLTVKCEQIWYVRLAEEAIKAGISTKQVLQILERLEATHQEQPVLHLTKWALTRVWELAGSGATKPKGGY